MELEQIIRHYADRDVTTIRHYADRGVTTIRQYADRVKTSMRQYADYRRRVCGSMQITVEEYAAVCGSSKDEYAAVC